MGEVFGIAEGLYFEVDATAGERTLTGGGELVFARCAKEDFVGDGAVL